MTIHGYTLQEIGKALAAVVGALATIGAVVVGALSDGHIDGGELALILATIGTTFGTATAVYKTPNNFPETPPLEEEPGV